MTVIKFPRPDADMETAETILYSDPALFTDDEVEAAAQYVLTYSRDWPTVEIARKALAAIHKRRREDDKARKALTNVYPELWPGLIIIGCAFGLALGIAIAVMP